MFNNIWNALSNSVWPFTVAVFNLWAIGKVGGFFISIIIRVIADMLIVITKCIPWIKAFCAG